MAEGEDLLAAADAAGWPRARALLRRRAAGSTGVEVEPELLAEVSGLGSGTRALGVYEERWAPAPAGPLCVVPARRPRPRQRRHGPALRAGVRRRVRRARAGHRRSVRPQGGARQHGRDLRACRVARVPRAPSTQLPGARRSRSCAGARRSRSRRTARDCATEPRDPGRQRPGALTLLVGAERDGLPDDARSPPPTASAHIPIRTHSLNAAMAATVALYEVTHRMARPHDRAHRPDPGRGRGGDRRRHRQRRARGACGSATSAARPSCRNLLRGVAELPPEQRGAVGKAANQARQALEALIERAGRRARGARARRSACRADRVDVTLPGDPLPADRAPAPADADAARDRGRLHRARLQRRRGPRGRDRLLQLRRAQPRRSTHPARERTDTFYVDRRRACLRTHTSPMQIRAMERAAAADLHHRPRPRLPPRLRRDAHAAVPPDRGARGRHRHHARPTSRARCWPSPGRSSATSARCACARTSSPSPSRASRSTSRASTASDGITADGPALPAVQGHRLDRDPRRRDGRPERVRATCASTATTPSRSRASRSGWGSSGSRCSSTASPTCACFFDNDVRFLEQFG